MGDFFVIQIRAGQEIRLSESLCLEVEVIIFMIYREVEEKK